MSTDWDSADGVQNPRVVTPLVQVHTVNLVPFCPARCLARQPRRGGDASSSGDMGQAVLRLRAGGTGDAGKEG